MFSVKIKRGISGSTGLSSTVGVPKGRHAVQVGFPEGSDATIAQRAVWNHFGTKGGASGGGWGGPIPERPFLSNAMRDNRDAYRANMTVAAAGILRTIVTDGPAAGRAELQKALSKLGILAQGDIQAEITALSSPPNSPVTIALKGSSNPLIDSGEMRQAVTWKIED